MVIRSLKGFGVYEAALRHGRRYNSGPATLTILLHPEGTSTNKVLVGVMVGKRTCPKSVVRSRIRRLLREAIRIVIANNESPVQNRNIAAILLGWRASIDKQSAICLADVQPHVEQTMLKALGISGNAGGAAT